MTLVLFRPRLFSSSCHISKKYKEQSTTLISFKKPPWSKLDNDEKTVLYSQYFLRYVMRTNCYKGQVIQIQIYAPPLQ